MRDHVSITLSKDTILRLKRYALRERRPVSQIVEMAVAELLKEHVPEARMIVTTRGSFRGKFAREECYEGR